MRGMDYVAALTAQDEQFAAAYRSADPAAPVPTCPGWTVRNLATHLGRGHRWAATMIRDRVTAPIDPRSVEGGRPPEDVDGTADWVIASGAAVLDAVSDATAAGTDATVWTFAGPQPAGWWLRRRLHESTVHRADLALALGLDYALPAELAADGVTEWLSLMAARPAPDADIAPLAADTGIHLHATDDGLGESGEWLVSGGPHGDVILEFGHGRGDVAVRGAAPDLLLALTRRIGTDDPRVEIIGDRGVWQTWLERTDF